MKHLIIAILILLLPGICIAADKQLVEKVTLQPNEQKEVSIEAKEKIKIGWNHPDSSDAASKCKNNCVEIMKPGSSGGMASMYGGTMGFEPEDGKAIAILKNKEDFPIEIEVFQKQIN